MGNGKKAPGVMDGRVYHLADMGDGYMAVVFSETFDVVGYMVPQGFAALFNLFYGYAPIVQALHNLPDPTEAQVNEILVRYLKKMGGKVKELAAEAILEVMKSDDWLKNPEWPWDFKQELVPESQRKRHEMIGILHGISAYEAEMPKDEPTTAESEVDDADGTEEPDPEAA